MKIAVLTSGGVDSSVTLRLLKEQGHKVTAFYLKIWLEDELAYLGDCPWEEDLAFVREICREADVPLEVVPFQKEYWKRVVKEAIQEVEAGRTPNPDMLCNAYIKFGAFYNFLKKNYSPVIDSEDFDGELSRIVAQTGGELVEGSIGGFDKIASGHYAQIEEKNGLTYLKRSPDDTKDQTYFLSQLSQEQLSKIIFPVGGLKKEEVRALAKKYRLPNAERKDSQGICFLGKIPFEKFLEVHLGKRPGNLVEYESGKVLGEHNGFWFYTIGQRRGIRLSGGPWYVVTKNSEKNEVLISHGEKYQESARDTFLVQKVNWLSGVPPERRDLQVKIRHGAKLYPATVDLQEGKRVKVTIGKKDPGIAGGQYAVFYEGEYCLGGGVIANEK